ncbi:MAG TPA: BON domain-containing protein [Thermoanaerobaculia bacterium]|jgi:osmotically-inducible protein OsmY
MKKTIASIAVALFVFSSFACSNWNKYTPKGMDATAIADEIRKNMLADGITGMTVNVDKDGVTTIKGDVKTSSDKQKAIDDARKVNGVTRVIDQVSIKP